MPRIPRQESPTSIYHWIVRGTNKKRLFHQRDDFDFFKKLLLEYRDLYELSIYHYCLMHNHAHIVVCSKDLKRLAGFSHYIQRRYAYYYCKTYPWSGCVFQRGYKSIPIEKEPHLLECGRYIERNPIRASIVLRIEDYQYSSYLHYKGAIQDPLVTYSPAYLRLDDRADVRRKLYTTYVEQPRPQEEKTEYFKYLAI